MKQNKGKKLQPLVIDRFQSYLDKTVYFSRLFSLQEILAVLRWPSSCPKVSLYGQEGCLPCGTCWGLSLIEEDEFSDVTLSDRSIKSSNDRIRDFRSSIFFSVTKDPSKSLSSAMH